MYYSTLLSSSNFKFIAEHETAIPSSPSGGCNEFSCTTQTINLFYEGDNAVASNDIIVDTESNYIIMSAISFNIDIMDEISIYKYKILQLMKWDILLDCEIMMKRNLLQKAVLSCMENILPYMHSMTSLMKINTF